MNTNVQPTRQEPVSKDNCRHYWIIESAHGPTSRGVCKFCGTHREFHNSWPYFPALKQSPTRGREKEESESEFEEVGENV